MQFNCDRHQQFHPIYIKLDDDQYFKCAKCITQYKISGDQLILVEEVNQYSQSSIISNWPPVNDSQLLSQVEQIVNKDSDKSQIKILNDFFENFRRELNEQLTNLQQIINIQINKYQNSNQTLLDVYNKLAEKQVFKQLLTSQTNTQESTVQFTLFLKDKIEQRSQISQELIKSIGNYNQSIQEIDLDLPKKIKEDIIHSLEKVCLYFQEDNYKQNNNKELNYNFRQMKFNSDQSNVDKLIQLISNKSNFCTQRFISKIEQILNKYSVLINKEDMEDLFIEQKQPIDFSSLSIPQLEDIREIVQNQTYKNKLLEEGKQAQCSPYIEQMINLISNRSNQVSKQSINKIKQSLEKVEPLFKDIIQLDGEVEDFHKIKESQYKTILKLAKKYQDIEYMNQPSENVNRILRLISNNSNFVRSKYLQEIEEKLDSLKAIIDEIQINDEDMFTSTPIDFRYMSYDQLQLINNLVKKYSEINHLQVDNLHKSPVKDPLYNTYLNESTNNTFIVLQYIDFKFFNESDKTKIRDILYKYPILDTIDIANPYKDLTKEVNFTPSLYNDSDKNVKIWRNPQQELVIDHFQYQSQSIQTVFDADLDPNLKYVVRIEIEPMNNFNYYSRIGLIRSFNKNTHRIFADNLCYCNQNSYGITKVIKGKRLNDPSLRFSLKARNLEFRIWIKGKIFMVADYPGYQNINSIEDDAKEIELYSSLTLGTLGFNIKSFIIKYFKVVDHFPQI
ncbi:hypothetical protein TTHERM_00584910 (macronuclear) [Tetrahymena thermophila SB210]|uniref:Zinc carboxypeptidase family protein n=1 Tax=Tetrahymena thermophila (strain SB210) TaxID=312017 RepID=I7LTB3_TETTS|nr:hypothetical protein TTHERM_00584910 [Tetrahymena thermophila SB210]EAR84934.2 hypothetical protein TTHERM_00584910 [Tetrahymena thermophila SB210]|eukprot:XP_001032597.2 hypothetical protein TTHERM_00584910 [Tetrahymena thermophila SB210]